MNKKNKSSYIPVNDLGSREEIEVCEQRIKELGKCNEQEDENSNNKITIFTSILIFTLTIVLSVIIQRNIK
ncbi:hypothetical protein WL507_13000 [Staphylococcus saprophyticus]|uniref:hypothetical protein n=1 Tax=Staphylococcus saprophyticus TaxID=29385 RepID=UPI0030BA93BE